MADPAAIVLAVVEVIIVAEPKAGMTELPIAPVLGLLRQLEVPLEVVRRKLVRLHLEELGDQRLRRRQWRG